MNPGWVSGETGMNEKGITVSENNIHIQQNQWDVMPIDQLSRKLLQYSKSIDDVGRILRKQKSYPAKLIFTSDKKTASIFEFANKEIASINMKSGYLAMANHACMIPSKNITSPSTKRLDFGNQFLKENVEDMDIEKAIELVRTSRISWRWNPVVHNRQSIIFSPATLDFWIAIPPESDYIPASYGPYVGFNLMQELNGQGHEPKGHVAIATSWSHPDSNCALHTRFGDGDYRGPVRFHMDLDEALAEARRLKDKAEVIKAKSTLSKTVKSREAKQMVIKTKAEKNKPRKSKTTSAQSKD